MLPEHEADRPALDAGQGEGDGVSVPGQEARGWALRICQLSVY